MWLLPRALLCAALLAHLAVDRAGGQQLRFENDILPLVEARCVKCHSGQAPQAGLELHSRAALLKGGNSGPAVVPGSAEKSLLYRRLERGEMPPGGPAIEPAELARWKLWIDQGAAAVHPEGAVGEPRTATPGRQHWAFQAPRRPAPPQVRSRERVRTPVDAFVLAELEKQGLAFSPDAGRVTLLRRLYFDLVGLPPSPAAADDFLADKSPAAYETVVDRLLASQHYGERWGRHWLDAAGYAESEGVLAADVVRPNAWRYRDYVIRAFNSDKPYDRFVVEQLAGDELAGYRKYDKLPPEAVEALEATGFLRTAVDATRDDFLPDHYAEYQWRTLFTTQQIAVTSLVGLSLHCARCHDHKYEPLSQRDYYRFQAFFAGAIRPNGPLIASAQRVIFNATKAEQAAASKQNGPIDELSKALRQLQRARLALYRGKHPKGDQANEDELRQAFPDYAAKAAALDQELGEAEARRINLPSIRALYDLDSTPPPTRLLGRGDPLDPKDEVSPAPPAVLDDPAQPFRLEAPAESGTTGRRLALARWLVRPDHPLTARVMVNRVWAGHFGAGIVPTIENFGRSGAAPANQPLLDWLATEFVRQGWSVKAMHRLIVTSTVYRQSSAARGPGAKLDPGNKLLWRMPRRRLEAEIVRDAVLEAAGTLDYSMFGEPVPAETAKSGEIAPVGETCGGRRSMYQIVRRSAPQSFLSAFDAPVMEINCTRRASSTSAVQALALMNGRFVRAQAEHFARRVLEEAPPADSSRVTWAFRLALARRPTPAELHTLLGFVDRQRAHYPDTNPDALALRVYSDLCQALVSANEFVYID